MISIRHSDDRGGARADWLDTRYSFSFADYHDPRHMGFRRLRVINEDVIAPSRGFGTHPHRDMEILTFMNAGSLEHRDSLGNGSVIRAGDAQRMTAGTGVRHSEVNPSSDEAAHLLQVWIEPEQTGLEPSYEQRSFGDGWQLVASRDGRHGSLTVHQDASVYRAKLAAGERRTVSLEPGRHAWIQVVAGDVNVSGHHLGAGDAAGVSEEAKLEIESLSDSHFLLFDLA